MKLVKKIIFVIVIGLLIIACGGASPVNPLDVVKKYMDAEMSADFAAIKECVTKDLIPDVDELIAEFETMTSEWKESRKQFVDQMKFDIDKAYIAYTSEDGNSTIVMVKIDFIEKSRYENISLIKEDGSWKIVNMLILYSTSSDNPSDVVKKIMDASMNFDFVAMKEYVTRELIPIIEQQIVAFETMTPEQKAQTEEYKKFAEQMKFDVGEAEISEDGNFATVPVKVDFMGQSMDNNISLVKEDGKWKIRQL